MGIVIEGPRKRHYSSVTEATSWLRKNSFKPDLMGDGPRVWKRVRDDQVERAEIEIQPSGRCSVKIDVT